jgi:hypothetical protein
MLGDPLHLLQVDGLSGARQRLGEALVVERLDQIVDRRHLERFQGELIEGGDEDGHRHRRHADLPDDLETVQPRHLYVEEDQLGGQAADGLHRFRAAPGRGHHGDIRLLGQKIGDPLPGQRLIVGDDHAKGLAVRHARPPGREG